MSFYFVYKKLSVAIRSHYNNVIVVKIILFLFQFLELFCRDHSEGQDEPLSTPSPSILLDLTQCADVLQESKLISSLYSYTLYIFSNYFAT